MSISRWKEKGRLNVRFSHLLFAVRTQFRLWMNSFVQIEACISRIYFKEIYWPHHLDHHLVGLRQIFSNYKNPIQFYKMVHSYVDGYWEADCSALVFNSFIFLVVGRSSFTRKIHIVFLLWVPIVCLSYILLKTIRKINLSRPYLLVHEYGIPNNIIKYVNAIFRSNNTDTQIVYFGCCFVDLFWPNCIH